MPGAMASHPYGLRSRINSQSPSARTTPAGSPIAKLPPAGGFRSRRHPDVALVLHKIIGTTTAGPSGLACSSAINSYAYCAGAVAVLAKVDDRGLLSHRYFRARPTAPSLNPPTSYYDNSPATTPSKRRTSTFTPRKGDDTLTSVSLGREWLEDSGGQTWTARERIKAASCVALSRDGRWLAIGEAGYNPRVLLFSTADDASTEIPTSIVSDHTHGVRCIAFSPDMKYLATLGNLNDGFLFIWALNSRTGQLTLHSVNKCTTTICDMTWCGNTLVTVGTRHIKLWHLADPSRRSPTRQPRFRRSDVYMASPGPAPLQGRNCLLGSMADSTFTCAVNIDDVTFVVGTETGHLCTADASQSTLELKVLKRTELGITSLVYDAGAKQLLVGTTLGLQHEDYVALTNTDKSPGANAKPAGFGNGPRRSSRHSAVRRSLGFASRESRHVTAIGRIETHTITLDSEGGLNLQHAIDNSQYQDHPLSTAQNSAVQGVLSLPVSAELGDFITWSKNGEVKFWNTEGRLLLQQDLNLDQPGGADENYENELCRIRYIPSTASFVAGDRYGILKLVNIADWKVTNSIRAHSAEISGMSVHAPDSLVATCSRDRMVQLFKVLQDSFELLQTMDDHAGSVSDVMFSPTGERLLSCATDRSLVIRDRVLRHQDGVDVPAYLSTKVLTLKASPLSITPSTNNLVLIATMDRKITKIDCEAGAFTESFKLGDYENDDTVFLNSIISAQGPGAGETSERVVIGYCSMDKSIRVYNEKSLSLVGRESGHTEGVSDIACLQQSAEVGSEHQTTIVSTGLDGTIMIWNLAKISVLVPGEISPERVCGIGSSSDDPDSPLTKQIPTSLPPLRKVLTKMDIADLTRPSVPPSPSSPRSLSPARIKRKKSRLALSTTIEDIEEGTIRSAETTSPSSRLTTLNGRDLRRSPSPPARPSLRPKPQRSKTDSTRVSGNGVISVFERSPSPPASVLSVPTTPKSRQRSNNIRLRRPPSVPTDLRGQANLQGRRRSMSGVPEYGSLGMATEQACRMLRTYRKKLIDSREMVDLGELENEVSMTMKAILGRKEKPAGIQTLRSNKGKASTEADVDQLTILMERANMAEPEPTTLKHQKVEETIASKG